VDVRDGMNRVIVTVGPDHTLREAARRMTRADVGAAVVIDPEAGGPGIITERDLLRASGSDEDLDAEHVRDHLTQRLTYASADWSLERAAGEMIRARFRHVVVVDGSEVVGILSMRDIVRCWTQDGAACGMSQSSMQESENPIGAAAAI
jgi:CBS domain-containing protein